MKEGNEMPTRATRTNTATNASGALTISRTDVESLFQPVRVAKSPKLTEQLAALDAYIAGDHANGAVQFPIASEDVTSLISSLRRQARDTHKLALRFAQRVASTNAVPETDDKHRPAAGQSLVLTVITNGAYRGRQSKGSAAE
jgi:hypothetical protein